MFRVEATVSSNIFEVIDASPDRIIRSIQAQTVHRVSRGRVGTTKVERLDSSCLLFSKGNFSSRHEAEVWGWRLPDSLWSAVEDFDESDDDDDPIPDLFSKFRVSGLDLNIIEEVEPVRCFYPGCKAISRGDFVVLDFNGWHSEEFPVCVGHSHKERWDKGAKLFLIVPPLS